MQQVNKITVNNTEYSFIQAEEKHYNKLSLVITKDGESYGYTISTLDFDKKYLEKTNDFLRFMYISTAKQISEYDFELITGDTDTTKADLKVMLKWRKEELKQLKATLNDFKAINLSLA